MKLFYGTENKLMTNDKCLELKHSERTACRVTNKAEISGLIHPRHTHASFIKRNKYIKNKTEPLTHALI